MKKKQEITMNELCDNWLKYIYYYVKYSTFSHYEQIVYTHISTYFNQFCISDISYNDIQEFIQFLAQKGNRKKGSGLAPKTINDILVVLKSILEYGSLHYETIMPIQDIRLLRIPIKEISVFPEHDYETLLSYLTNNITLSKLGILICLYTGLRIGEICALSWKDIDMNIELISVNQTIYRVKNWGNESDTKKTKLVIASPKTSHSIRKVPISKKIIPYLNAFAQQFSADSYVLTGTSVPLEPRTYQYQYRRHLEMCEIPYLNFHALRHTFSTRCIEKGCDIKSLSEMLGHSSTSVTLQKYVFSSYSQKKHFLNLL